MAPASGHENPALKGPASPETENALREAPFDFDFFQAVRLLGRFLKGRQPVGRFSDPEAEVVRFGAVADFAFPPSQIAKLEWPEDGQPHMDVSFMGLNGPQGVLPLCYSALICERLRTHDDSMREFFNIFNHRMISLFYRAWEKYHFMVGYERGEGDPLSPHLMDMLGLGTPDLAGRQAVTDEALVFRCGLLAMHTRSAAGLRALLMDYFEVPVEIEQFMGRWYPIDEDTQCSLKDTGADSERLGVGTVVGDEIWDQQSGVRIRIGPMTLEQYLDFLPDGSAHSPLRALIRFFSGNELDIELQLVLRKEETPACELGREGPTAPRLGWLSWARTAPLPHDAEETILRI